jgi:hypothetical protein
MQVHEALVRGADHPVLTQPLDGSGQNLQKKPSKNSASGLHRMEKAKRLQRFMETTVYCSLRAGIPHHKKDEKTFFSSFLPEIVQNCADFLHILQTETDRQTDRDTEASPGHATRHE